MKTNFLLLAAALVFITGCNSESAENEETPTATFSVSGVVTKSDGGGAAAGASVMAVNTTDDSNVGQAPSNAYGEYVITGIPSGVYNIVASLSGYNTTTIANVKITSSDITGQNIVLQKITVPTYSISGTVTKSDGSPAANASVQVLKASDKTTVGETVTTNESGQYAIENIPEGEYLIIIKLDGYETATLTDISVTNSNLTGKNAVLQPVSISSDAVSIHYEDNQATVTNPYAEKGVTITADGAHVTVSTSVSEAIEYIVSGSTANGSLKIQNNASLANTLKLTLNSVVIRSASKLPPVQITKNEGVTIVELKGVNVLADNASNEENATLISKSGSLQFDGYGSLSISGLAKHAIASSKKNISVISGEITVTEAASDGFHAENGFEITGGSLEITAMGDGIDAGSGAAVIRGGNIQIASNEADTKGIKGDAGVTVGGGVIAMTVTGAQSKGISSKADVTITGGSIDITTSGATVLNAVGSGFDPSYSTAIKSDANITVSAGTIDIKSLKSANGGKGISADGDISIQGGDIIITTAGDGAIYTTETGANDSYTASCIKSDKNILLLGGNITCSSSGTGGKGVNADGSITVGLAGANNADLKLTVSTSGERFLVSGNSGGGNRPGGGGAFGGGGSSSGTDYANPKAIKAEGDVTVNSGTITVICSQKQEGGEGMESKGAFTINGGAIDISSYDDCINGGKSVTINGGTTFVAARGQDAIDSNGSLTINGGLTIANGVRGDGESFDGQTGKYPVNGGIIVGTCSNMMEAPAGPQRSVIYSRASAGSDICIKNSSGENILLFRVPVISGASNGTTLIVVFSDPRLVAGTYTLLSGGKIDGGVNFNGYFTGGTYSGGSTKSFTIGSSAYTVVQ
ncbi:MAG: carbohydrate-binding domain-containing protein [Tannerella sp.]|nr:carbohydrate-binding domain-containing protein [Tannerella sp.]